MVTCRECGDVVVPVTRCQLRRCEDDGLHSLAYRCARCGKCDVVPSLHANEIVELLDAGLVVVPWEMPLEVTEPHFAGGPLQLDDLLDFHLLLDNDEWWPSFDREDS
jgi:hypothetical protein